MTGPNQIKPRLIAYWADESGWHKVYTNEPSDWLRHGYRPEQRGAMTHWAICHVDRDDGGLTPPPGVPIYTEEP